MALNYVFGMQPGESQIANAASQLNANNQRDIDRQISMNQSAVARQQQAEQFDRQMKQQRLFSGINAGLGIAQTVMGIPNFVGAVRDMFGPTARQQQAGQFAEDMALKRAQLGIQAASAGTDAAVKLANAESLKMDREAKLERTQAMYGTSMMLNDVPRQHQEYLIDLASKGDPIARTQAMNMGLMVHTDYQKSRMAELQRDRQQIANSPEYDDIERAYAFAQIDGQLQLLQNSPVVNRNRQLSGQERANASFQTVNITQPDGTVYSQPVQVNSRGNYDPIETPVTVFHKEKAKKEAGLQAELDFYKNNPQDAELVASIVGSGSGSGSGSRSRSGGGVGNGLTKDGFDPSAVDFDSRIKVMDSLLKSNLDLANANKKENEPLNMSSVAVTPQQVEAYLGALSAFESRSDKIKAERMATIGQSLLPAGSQPVSPQVSAPTMVTQQVPGNGPVGSQMPFPNNAAMPATPPATNPPMANIPSGRPQVVKLATRQKIEIPPVDAETQKVYSAATQNIPRIPGTEIVPLESDGKNLAAAMGLEKLYMIRDSRSELPWIPSIPKVLAKFTEVAPPNAQFYDYKGIKRTITKPASIPK